MPRPQSQQPGFPQAQQPNGQLPGQGPSTLRQHSQSPLQEQPLATSGIQQAQAVPLPSQNRLVSQQDSESITGRATPGSGSPPVGSPVSHVSQPSLFSPADLSRQQNASPVSLRHPTPMQHPGPVQSDHLAATRYASTPTPPGQLPARKPVNSSPKPPNNQFKPNPVGPEGQQGQRLLSISSQNQGSPLPQPPPGVQIPGVQNTQNAQAQLLYQRQHSQPQSSPPTPQGSQTPQPAPVPGPLPSPKPQEQAQGFGNMQAPPVQQLIHQPTRPTDSQQGGQMGPGYGFPATRLLSHSSNSAPGLQPPLPGQPLNSPRNSLAMSPPHAPKEQSTFSKLLRGPRPPSGTGAPAHEKAEKGKSSFMSAFKRGAKPAENHAQPIHGQAPPLRQGPPQTQPGQPREPDPHAHPQPQKGLLVQYQYQRHSPPNASTPPPNGSPVAQKTNPQQADLPSQPSSPFQAQSPSPAPSPAPARFQAQGQAPPQGQPQGQPRPPHQPQNQVQAQGQPQRQLLLPQQAVQTQQGPLRLVQPGQPIPPPLGPPAKQQDPTPKGQHSAQQAYPQVPIPAGYGYVHGEGRVAVALQPCYVGTAPGGQPYGPSPAQMGQAQQQWTPQGPGMRQVSGGPAPGQQIMYQRADGGQAQGQVLLPPNGAGVAPLPNEQVASNRQAQAVQAAPQGPPQTISSGSANSRAAASSPRPSTLTPTPQATPAGLSTVSPSPANTLQPTVSLPETQYQPRPEGTHFSTASSSLDRNASPPPQPPPQIQHPASPQSYPLPDSAFSPINPAAAHFPNPPPPRAFIPDPQLQSQLVPQRQVSAASQVSLLPGNSPPHQGSNLSSPASHVGLVGPSPNVSPSPHITPERAVSPEPPLHAVAPNHTIIDSRTVSPEPPAQAFAPPPPPGHHVVEENIYDATPRHSVLPPAGYQQEHTSNHAITAATNPAEPKSIRPPRQVVQPPQHIIVETPPPTAAAPPAVAHSQPVVEPPSPPIHPATTIAHSSSNGNGDGNSNGHDAPPKTSADIFEEAKRKMLLREQEEKIPVYPTEPDMNFAAAAAARRKDQEDMPQMSATSYPGQEWNPYGDGVGEEWD
ncbi:hypothetical protein B0T22DRAFT_455782 [Podospora appendiculata]|uniref:Uncharacterized protein n=1 Tax=Podospora appendiculata TaxID=314037 RepID=A0AAE0XLE0_9PEZI|nr:hypothetical protein B0T22DRAFT_455782 [Podospora appendiculata]